MSIEDLAYYSANSLVASNLPRATEEAKFKFWQAFAEEKVSLQ